MALDIAGGLFQQNDVRETPIGTATANAFTFDTDDFTDAAGNISLKNKTSYWSCPASNFKALFPDVNDVFYAQADSYVRADVNDINFIAPVNLPHGAIVTGVIVYGNISNETWGLMKATISSGAGVAMANANINTEDNTVGSATIDNSTACYFLYTSSLDNTDKIYGARITYTTDYD